MREIPAEKITVYAGAVAAAIVLTPLLHKVKRSGGEKPLPHILYAVFSGLVLFFCPEWIQDELFSPGGVLLLGTVLPIYESIVAACSITSLDDAAWLQFWVTSGSFSFATEFMDEIREQLPSAGEHWYEFEFFFTLWLILPFTDGSGLIYNRITKPFIAPVAQKLKNQLEGWAAVVLTVVNTSYLCVVWFAFLSLGEDQRRFVVVLLGTLYPMAASMVSITTESDTIHLQEQTYWLTYWAVFSIQFVLMDYLENFVGHITGFYTLCAVSTLYLFLPMFRGAEVVFRRVLVPLSGQYENMLLHDAYLVKLTVQKSIPADQHDRVMSRAADVFKSKKG